MTIINQPFQGQLGEILIDEIHKNYTELTIFSAFAKNSGILRLKKTLENFKEQNGTINAFIGIDLDGTSYEALLNLFHLCDNLYVIHSENFSTTYHSKIYLLKNASTAWCAIGSNNLTGGGLWSNFESCFIQTFDLIQSPSGLDNVTALISKYTDPAYQCSCRISSIDDIHVLLDAGYIPKESVQKTASAERQTKAKKTRKKISLFGSEKAVLPKISIENSGTSRLSPEQNGKKFMEYTIDMSREAPAFTNEQFWFETRAFTGGSSNILDLSKLGLIMEGSVFGTPYEYPDPRYMYGGVRFFDLDPNDTAVTKNITINYQGKDYYPSTIKFTPGNGSWRIQLKGSPNDNTEDLSRFGGRGDFVHKILLFEKISSYYYALSSLDETELDYIKRISRVWACNGKNKGSKAYGML